MDDKTDKSRWVRCPSCYCKTRIKVYEDSTIQQLALLSIVITLLHFSARRLTQSANRHDRNKLYRITGVLNGRTKTQLALGTMP